MSDVHERHGIVKNNGQAVTADERPDCIRLIANDGVNQDRIVFLTPNEARHIATKLMRIARRLEERLSA